MTTFARIIAQWLASTLPYPYRLRPMKRIHRQLLFRFNLLIGALAGLLAGCSTGRHALSNKIMAMYGIPMASYDVSGTVRDERRKPIEGAQVVIKGYKNLPIGDTLRTDAKGRYALQTQAWPCDTVNIVVSDPQTLQTDSLQIPAEMDRHDSWNSTVRPIKADIRLPKATEE